MTDTMTVQPITPTFGAIAEGLLAGPLNDAQFDQLQRAVVEQGVVFLRNRSMDDAAQLELAGRFGTLTVYPVNRLAGDMRPLEFIEDTAADPPKATRWHSDISWLAAPPKFAFLNMQIAPASGGDTVWADTQAAYEALSPVMQSVLREVRVVHRVEPESFDRFAARFGEEVGDKFRAEFKDGVSHPLVRRNPDSGKLALYLSGYWMDAIEGMHRAESDALLGYLMAFATQHRFTIRWRWDVNDLAVWDERRTMHQALPDHYPQHRKVRRCTVDGEVPLPV